jgi:hypothetical protein
MNRLIISGPSFLQNVVPAGSLSANTIVASSSDVNYPVDFLVDGSPSTYWKGTDTSAHTITVDFGSSPTYDVDGVGVQGFNYSDGWDLAVQSSPDNSTWTNFVASSLWSGSADLYTGKIPQVRHAVLGGTSVLTRRYWRLNITPRSSPSVPPRVNNLSIHRCRKFEIGSWSGEAPETSARDVKILDNSASTGLLIGRSVLDRGTQFGISLEMIRQSWATTWLYDLQRYLETAPVHVDRKDISGGDSDAVLTSQFCWHDGDVNPPVRLKQDWLSWNLKFRGIR